MYKELEDLGIDLKGKKTGKIKTYCPVCAQRKGHTKDRDLSVNIDEGLYQCWSEKCNFQGTAKARIYNRPDAEKIGNLCSKNVIEFFRKRGIEEPTIADFKIWSHGDTIYYNYYKKGVVINYKKRNISKTIFGQHEGAEKLPYNFDSLVGKTKCILVEGENDVLVWHQLGFSDEYAIISLDNGAGMKDSRLDGKLLCLTNAAKELNEISMFYLAGDMDEAGEYTMREVARRLGEYRCKRICYQTKDANDELIFLINEKAPKEDIKGYFTELIEFSKIYPTAGVQVLDAEMEARMLDEYEHGEKKGTPLGGNPIDEFYTVYEGEMTVWTGYPGDGKSTFVKNLAVLEAMANGFKFAVYSPEDADAIYYYKELCKIYMGKQIDPRYGNRADIAEYKSAINWVSKRFFYIYPDMNTDGTVELPTNEWINKKIAFLKLQYGVNSYIKDPWNKIHHDMKGLRDDQYLASEIRSEKTFASGYNACWYVVHPNKPSKSKDGKVLPPDQYDLSQGAMWNNGADNIAAIFRPERHIDKKSRLVHVMFHKIKKKGVVGQEGILEMNYNFVTNRYESIEQDVYENQNFAGMYKAAKNEISADELGLFEDLPF